MGIVQAHGRLGSGSRRAIWGERRGDFVRLGLVWWQQRLRG